VNGADPSPAPLPLFGAKHPGCSYDPRPGSYAVVTDGEGRVAIVEENDGWYLPGGGIEAGETPEEALHREVREECDCGVVLERPCGEAIEFLENRAGRRLEVHARYWRARFVGEPKATWLTPAEAAARVRRRSDAWIIRATGAGTRARLVDLSHAIHDGLVTYPGLPAPCIREHLDRASSRAHYAPGTEFSIARIDMVANTGTYLDAPFHRYESGRDVAALDLETLVELPGFLVRAPEGVRAIDAAALEAATGARELVGHAVLVATGWSRHFGTPAYGHGHPYLTRDAAAFLADRGAALVGIDSLNIDDISTGERPVHSLLLAREVHIVEHLNHLTALPDTGFRFSAAPPRVRGLGSFPVRAFARLEEPEPATRDAGRG